MRAEMSRFFRVVLTAAGAVAACLLVSVAAQAQGDRDAKPGDFDYYVLSMSWSPTYCDGQREEQGGARYDRGGYNRYNFYGGRRNYGRDDYEGGEGYGRRKRESNEQCDRTRPYAFVLHGLWPQYERRGWPEMCRADRRSWVSEDTIDRMMDIMPSRPLIISEYRKHGTCSGLDPQAYFDKSRDAYRSIRIPGEFQDLSKSRAISPDDVKRAFIESNGQLQDDMVQVVCSRRLLQEVRVCLSKDLTPRPCSKSRNLCNYDMVLMPPVRGGGVGPRGGPTERERERDSNRERDRM